MPMLIVFTNVQRSNVPDDFCKAATKVVASMIGKPEGYVNVSIVPDAMMTFGGTDEPCASVLLQSIGGVGPGKNNGHSKKLAALLKEKIGVDADRMFISFTDVPGSSMGWNASTFG